MPTLEIGRPGPGRGVAYPESASYSSQIQSGNSSAGPDAGSDRAMNEVERLESVEPPLMRNLNLWVIRGQEA